MLPAPLLIQAPAGWDFALAPLLGAIGVAPVYPARGTGAEHREPRGTRGARLGLAGGGRGGHGLSAALRHRGARTRRLERVPRRRGHARARSHPRAGVAARRRSLGRRRRGARGPDPRPDRRTRAPGRARLGGGAGRAPRCTRAGRARAGGRTARGGPDRGRRGRALGTRDEEGPRGHPISAVAPHFRRIVRQRPQPLRDGAARVPLPGV